MWAANAATVAPSSDTVDNRVHFVPAGEATLAGPYFPGRLRGDRVTLCVRDEELRAAPAAGKQLCMTRLGLGESSLGAGELLLHVGRRAPDLLVRALEQLGERKLDVGADPLDLGKAILACLFEERCERVLVKPGRRLGEGRDRGHLGRRARRREVAEQAGLLEPRFAVLGDLHREEPLVDHLPESIHHARPVEVDARRAFVLERVEGRTPSQNV